MREPPLTVSPPNPHPLPPPPQRGRRGANRLKCRRAKRRHVVEYARPAGVSFVAATMPTVSSSMSTAHSVPLPPPIESRREHSLRERRAAEAAREHCERFSEKVGPPREHGEDPKDGDGQIADEVQLYEALDLGGRLQAIRPPVRSDPLSCRVVRRAAADPTRRVGSLVDSDVANAERAREDSRVKAL